MKPGALVIVTWDDAVFAIDADEITDARYRVRTVGWLVSRSKRSVIVAAERLPDGRYRGVTRIPSACVLRVRRVRK